MCNLRFVSFVIMPRINFSLCPFRQVRPPASSWKKLEETREYKNGNTLREYQLEGVNWLLFNWYNRYVSYPCNIRTTLHLHL